MEFNDFPILTNDEYEKMKNEYFSNLTNSNDIFTNKICLNLFDCISICNGLNNKTDKSLRSIIEKAKTEIVELYSDICFSYKIKKQAQVEIKNFDVFLFLKNLVDIASMILKNKNSFNNNEKILLSSIEYKIILIIESIINYLSNKHIFLMKHF